MARGVIKGAPRLLFHHQPEHPQTASHTTDPQEYTEIVTVYIRKCLDDVTVSRTISIQTNQKALLTGKAHGLLRAQNAAIRAGNEEGLRTTGGNLSQSIREAKRQYSR